MNLVGAYLVVALAAGLILAAYFLFRRIFREP